MMRLGRRYRFAASHRLHAVSLSAEENRALYGKCNNPHGHGHNYEVEVTLRGPVDDRTGRAADPRALDELVRGEVIAAFDHKNLNTQIPAFGNKVPTSENLGLEICRRLQRAWPRAFPGGWPQLDKIEIAETGRNIFQVSADEIEQSPS